MNDPERNQNPRFVTRREDEEGILGITVPKHDASTLRGGVAAPRTDALPNRLRG